MSVLRLIAALLMLVAAITLATDATRAYWGDGTVFTSLARHINDLAPQSLASARRSVAAALHPAVWDLGIAPLLALPGWVSFTLLACVAGWFGRRRRRINIYAN